jgi:cofilin
VSLSQSIVFVLTFTFNKSSGVTVQDVCLDVFQELKLKKAHTFIVYKLSDDLTQIIVDQKSSEGDYDAFIAALPGNECRWAVYDFEYEKPGEGMRNKICFYAW